MQLRGGSQGDPQKREKKEHSANSYHMNDKTDN